jgi:hypothetical protein
MPESRLEALPHFLTGSLDLQLSPAGDKKLPTAGDIKLPTAVDKKLPTSGGDKLLEEDGWTVRHVILPTSLPTPGGGGKLPTPGGGKLPTLGGGKLSTAVGDDLRRVADGSSFWPLFRRLSLCCTWVDFTFPTSISFFFRSLVHNVFTTLAALFTFESLLLTPFVDTFCFIDADNNTCFTARLIPVFGV